MARLLEVHELQTQFKTEGGMIPSVNRVSFQVNHGETLALVGESGSGKSVTAMSILGLVAAPGKIVGGKILFEGQDLLNMPAKKMRKMRGNDLSIIFQEPMTSLNPVFTIGNQISEVLRAHYPLNRQQAREKSIEMLEKVGIARADKIARSFPHQLSGGMRQRVMIAIALACKPKLLIADEPTTALDVTIQSQILNLIERLAKEENTGVILITHDLGVVAEMADKVAVMYAGEIVETAGVYELFEKPLHPYTKGLLASLPVMNETRERLDSIKGMVPNLLEMPSGCPFHPRCPYAIADCQRIKPELQEREPGRLVSCIRTEEVQQG